MVQKEVNKNKLIESTSGTTGDWRKSRLVFVISGLITHLYDMKACIKNLLRDIDDICMVVAHLNDSKVWIDGTFPLKSSGDHISISSLEQVNKDDCTTYRYIEQRSPAWHTVRNTAKITGSTMFNALALGTLKCQQEHYDCVLFGKEKPEPTSSVKEKMQYGVDNEIHAIATFAGKFLPVFHPDLYYFEEGCYKITTNNNVGIIVSPDGSCRKSVNDQAIYGIECKCPFPGKTYSTTVHYSIPKYYVPQIISEMHCLSAKQLYFISYSKESTTIQRATYNVDIWERLEQESSVIFDEKSSRPSRKSQSSKEIQDLILQYGASHVELIAEVRSIQGDKSSACERSTSTSHLCSLDTLIELLSSTRNDVQRAYDLTRTKASELLAFMISDLDREFSYEQLHSVPIAYGLKSYSLPTCTVRKMIETVLTECARRGLYIPVCSFDGQWWKVAVRDEQNRPLTVLQLQKDVYNNVRKLSKSEIVRILSSRNVVRTREIKSFDDLKSSVGFKIQQQPRPAIYLWSNSEDKAFVMSQRTVHLLREKSKCPVIREETQSEIDNGIMRCLPTAVVSQMDDDLVMEVQCIEKQNSSPSSKSDFDDLTALFSEENEPQDLNTEEPRQNQMDNPEKTNINADLVTENDISLMLEELKAHTKSKRTSIWMISSTDFKAKMKSAPEINKNFLAYELQLCLKPILGKLKIHGFKANKTDPKYLHVNLFSKLLGNNTELSTPTSRKTYKVNTLKALCRSSLNKIPKEKLNIVLSENVFPVELEKWYGSCPYGKNINIEGSSSEKRKQWYSYPEMNTCVGYYVFMILDAYHQLCGLRRLLCSNGIPEAGISNKPLHKVAEESEFNGCGLSVALVKDMIDKQSVAYAVQTFSEKVEAALNAIGAHEEAEFCSLVRHWYKAEDDPGIPAIIRCEHRLKFRDWLLDGINFGEFPPPGAFVKGIPVILYEGLLTGIERRIQLFPLVKSGRYNVRCIGSLDVENFFGGFQDYDPWGTGVLRPDSIPTAISVAAELQEARLDPNKVFHMYTSCSKVYPSTTYDMIMDISPSSLSIPKDISNIIIRDHGFDKPERARGARKRKRGTVSKPEEPSAKPLTVREFHRAHEAKLLPHVRRGLVLNDV